jgi:cold shock CspA family protein
VEINKQFGFIEAEDYRNDVFFHFRQWEPDESNSLPKLDQVVEFEIDELHRREEGKLRVKWIRPTNRPLGTKMLARSTPHLMVKHHPKARQSKPSWRGKNKKSDD